MLVIPATYTAVPSARPFGRLAKRQNCPGSPGTGSSSIAMTVPSTHTESKPVTVALFAVALYTTWPPSPKPKLRVSQEVCVYVPLEVSVKSTSGGRLPAVPHAWLRLPMGPVLVRVAANPSRVLIPVTIKLSTVCPA